MAASTCAMRCSLVLGAWFCATHGATYDLSGRVLRPDGEPAANATVYWLRTGRTNHKEWGVRGRAVTGGDGTFGFSGVTRNSLAGVYDSVLALTEGYGLACWRPRGRQEVKLPVTMKLSGEAVLRGTAVDEGGQPVAGARVALRYVGYWLVPYTDHASSFIRGDQPPELMGETGPEGIFVLRRLPQMREGRVCIRVTHPRLAVAQQEIQLKDLAKEAKFVLGPAGAIAGRVTHQRTKRPGAALVVCASRLGDRSGLQCRATTDPKGSYRIANLPAGSYQVEVVVEHRAEWVTVPRDGVAVEPDKTASEVNLLLCEGGFVCGIVVDAATDEPLAGVRVDIRPATASRANNYVGLTQPDGTFRLRCPPGVCSVELSSIPDEYLGLSREDRRTVTVHVGKDSDPLEFALRTSVAITGKVVGLQGEPAAGARVRAVTAARRTKQVTADAQGAFRVAGSLPNSMTSLVILDAQHKLGAKRDLSVGEEGPRGLTIKLAPVAKLVGRVVDGDGNPLKDTRVQLNEYTNRCSCCPARAFTDHEGRYEFVTAPGTKVSVCTTGEHRASGGRPFDVEAGKTYEIKDLVVRPPETTTIFGRVLGVEGQPVPHARVTLRAGRRPAGTRSDTRGRFHFAGVRVDDQSAGIWVRDLSGKLGGAQSVAVRREPTRDVTIKLSPLATLTGRVVGSDGRPVGAAQVTVREYLPGAGAYEGRAHTGEDGRFEIATTPDTSVGISVTGAGGAAARRSALITVKSGERHQVDDLVIRRRVKPRVSGRVLDLDAKPVSRAEVYLATTGSTTSTNGQGEFSFGEVEARGRTLDLVATSQDRRLGAKIVVPTTTGPVAINLARACTVKGRVVDVKGQPIAGAQVHVYVGMSDRGYHSRGKAETDGQGQYRVAGIPPNCRGHVTASADGYARRSIRDRTFRGGALLDIEDLVLLRTDSFVAGKVTDLDGNPVPGVSVTCHGRGCGHKSTVTDSQGRYRVNGIPKTKTLTVDADRPGYGRDTRRNVESGKDDVDLRLPHSVSPKPRARLGKAAPEPTISVWLNAKPVKLADLRGKVVVVHFWTRYSRPCLRSMHTLIALHEQYADDLAVIAIHDRATPVTEVREFVQENQVEFPVGIVKSTKQDGWAGETFRAYGVKSLPAAFLIDRKGVLRQMNVTGDLAAQVKALIEE